MKVKYHARPSPRGTVGEGVIDQGTRRAVNRKIKAHIRIDHIDATGTNSMVTRFVIFLSSH